LPGYTAYRHFCNMTEVEDFDDLKNDIRNGEVRSILKDLYGHVDNIDVWPGGILEEPLAGAKVGPLFTCIIVEQMRATRDGDR
jgi:hypothetical protein